MLHDFIAANRSALIRECRARVTLRGKPRLSDRELAHGVPQFLDELVVKLKVERAGHSVVSSAVSLTAGQHGRELLEKGFTLEQVVREYGDVCQAISQLAMDKGAYIGIEEFKILNRCLDDAIAVAVTEFASARDSRVAEAGVQSWGARLGLLAHELRNHVQTATLAVGTMRQGGVGMSGATGAVLDRSLVGLRTLIDRSLADVRATADLPARVQLVSMVGFIADIQGSASLEARLHECELSVSAVDPALAVDVDKPMLYSAVGNLLQNAFKFTRPHSRVSLGVRASADRILIEVADQCGGIPGGDAERLFRPFGQFGADTSGVGLGLAICRRCVEANKGVLTAHDVPGSGCVFTIDLPRSVRVS